MNFAILCAGHTDTLHQHVEFHAQPKATCQLRCPHEQIGQDGFFVRSTKLVGDLLLSTELEAVLCGCFSTFLYERENGANTGPDSLAKAHRYDHLAQQMTSINDSQRTHPKSSKTNCFDIANIPN
jgi:hypothetical protein